METHMVNEVQLWTLLVFSLIRHGAAGSGARIV